jgi:hypothetical protein
MQFQFISLSTDPLQGQRPHGYRNSQTMQVTVIIIKLASKQLSHYHINDKL